MTYYPPLPGGSTKFTDLTDTPSSYSGQANKLAAVNSVADAIEFLENVKVPPSDHYIYDIGAQLLLANYKRWTAYSARLDEVIATARADHIADYSYPDGMTIWLRPGASYDDVHMILINGHRQAIRCPGYARIALASGQNSHVISEDTSSRWYGTVLEGLELDGNGSGQTSGDCNALNITNTASSTLRTPPISWQYCITRCRGYNSRTYGLRFDPASPSTPQSRIQFRAYGNLHTGKSSPWDKQILMKSFYDSLAEIYASSIVIDTGCGKSFFDLEYIGGGGARPIAIRSPESRYRIFTDHATEYSVEVFSTCQHSDFDITLSNPYSGAITGGLLMNGQGNTVKIKFINQQEETQWISGIVEDVLAQRNSYSLEAQDLVGLNDPITTYEFQLQRGGNAVVHRSNESAAGFTRVKLLGSGAITCRFPTVRQEVICTSMLVNSAPTIVHLLGPRAPDTISSPNRERNRKTLGEYGVIVELYAEIYTAPGAGKTYDFNIDKNDVKQSVPTVQLTNTVLSALDNANYLNFGPTDYLYHEITPTATPVQSYGHIRIAYWPRVQLYV